MDLYLTIVAILAVALDVYIFVLPIPTILRLQMSPTKRLSVLGVFGTAFL